MTPGDRFLIAPGFVRIEECPDCGHTRCGEGCVCNCDAARAEVKVDKLLAALEDMLVRFAPDNDSLSDAEIACADRARALVGKRREP